MRTLTFDPTDRKYEVIYQTCVFGDAPKDRTEGKALGSVCDKFEAIGQLVPLLDDKGRARQPNRNEIRLYETVGGGVVVLEEAEYDLLVRRVTAAIPTTIPGHVREMERALSWLELLPKHAAKAVEAEPKDVPAVST